MARKKKESKQFINLIIIDASGSMERKKASVRDGLHELFISIKKQAKGQTGVEFKTIVVDFSGHNDIRTLINEAGTKGLTKELANAYETRDMTALNDAIGYAFGLVPSGATSVFVNILTDGLENDSRKFSNEAIKSLIDESKKAGWGITFMGTTEEAINSAVNLGISRGNTVLYTNSARGTVGASMARNKMSATYFDASVSGQSVDTENLSSSLTDEEWDALKDE